MRHTERGMSPGAIGCLDLLMDFKKETHSKERRSSGFYTMHPENLALKAARSASA